MDGGAKGRQRRRWRNAGGSDPCWSGSSSSSSGRYPRPEPTHAIFIGMKSLILVLLPLVPLIAASPAPPIRGLHLMAPAPEDIPLAVRFIKEALPKEGVNVLVLEFDYRYQFTKRPEVAEPDALSARERQTPGGGVQGRGRQTDSPDQPAGPPVVGQIHRRAAASTSGVRRNARQISAERGHLLPQLLPAASPGA